MSLSNNPRFILILLYACMIDSRTTRAGTTHDKVDQRPR